MNFEEHDVIINYDIKYRMVGMVGALMKKWTFGGNDQFRANTAQTFAAPNMGRDKAKQILCRTI